MRRSHRNNAFGLNYGISDELVDADRGVGNAIDERGVGSVFEETAHQISEQRLVRADRRVDAARAIELALRDRADDLVVEWLAHSVKALEFELLRAVGFAGEMVDRRQGQCVVGGELRVDGVRRREQLL